MTLVKSLAFFSDLKKCPPGDLSDLRKWLPAFERRDRRKWAPAEPARRDRRKWRPESCPLDFRDRRK